MEMLENEKLVETVFLRLSMRDILVNVQRVCKRFHSVVGNSDRLQQALFFKPVTSRPLTYNKPLRNIVEAESPIGKSGSFTRLPRIVSPATSWHHELPFAQSFSPPGTPRLQHMDSIKETPSPLSGVTSTQPTHARSTKTTPESSLPTGLFRKTGRKNRKHAHIAIESPCPSRKSSSTSLPPASPRLSIQLPCDPDSWDQRFYTVTEKHDLRQFIFEHPLVSRHDAHHRKYSINSIGGQCKASWRRQLLTQPPVASVKILGDKHAKKRDQIVYASDGVGVRLWDVAKAMKLQNMEYLAYEGKEWGKPCEWTKGQTGSILQRTKRSVGDGPWGPVSGESKRAGMYL